MPLALHIKNCIACFSMPCNMRLCHVTLKATLRSHCMLMHAILRCKQCMEKFKAIEKELKRKAFSKEGLDAVVKVDPLEVERQNLAEWLSNTVSELSNQIDTLEAEQESLLNSRGKNKRLDAGKTEQLAKLTNHIERHKHHITTLEIVLRMFENESLTIDEVRDLQDNVNYYVDCNRDPDFAEDEFIYDDLDLEEAEVFGLAHDDHNDDQPEGQGAATTGKEGASPVASAKEGSGAAGTKDGKEVKDAKGKTAPAAPAANPTPAAAAEDTAKGAKSKLPTMGTKSTLPPVKAPVTTKVVPPAKPFAAAAASGTPAAATAAKGAPVEVLAVLAPPSTPAPLQRYAQAAAAHVPAAPVANVASVPAEAAVPVLGARATPVPANAPPSAASPEVVSASGAAPTAQSLAAHFEDLTLGSGAAGVDKRGPTPTAKKPIEAAVPASGPSPQPVMASNAQPQVSTAARSNISPAPPAATSTTSGASAPVPAASRSPAAVPSIAPAAGPSAAAPTPIGLDGTTSENRIPASLLDLVASFEVSKQRALKNDMSDPQSQSMLEQSLKFVPESVDAERWVSAFDWMGLGTD
jgi:CCR4-NOT transcription complex subunit 3